MQRSWRRWSAATIGSLSLCFGDPREWSRFTSLWLTWWMGDGFGALIVSPFLLAWSSPGKTTSQDVPEIASLFVLLIIVALIVFAGWFPGPVKTYPLAYLCLPCLLWAALKFDQRVVSARNRSDGSGAVLTVRLPAMTEVSHKKAQESQTVT